MSATSFAAPPEPALARLPSPPIFVTAFSLSLPFPTYFMRSRFLALLLTLLPLLFGACVTHIKPTVVQNPPPAEKFSAFNHFELSKVVLPPPYAGQAPNERALIKIQENVSLKMTPALAGWNAAGA